MRTPLCVLSPQVTTSYRLIALHAITWCRTRHSDDITLERELSDANDATSSLLCSVSELGETAFP
jgi:hypothetical protein